MGKLVYTHITVERTAGKSIETIGKERGRRGQWKATIKAGDTHDVTMKPTEAHCLV